MQFPSFIKWEFGGKFISAMDGKFSLFILTLMTLDDALYDPDDERIVSALVICFKSKHTLVYFQSNCVRTKIKFDDKTSNVAVGVSYFF